MISTILKILKTPEMAVEEVPPCTARETLLQQVRELAYKKWEEAERPLGRDEEFWLKAEREILKN